jgi:hypothetical protein
MTIPGFEVDEEDYSSRDHLPINEDISLSRDQLVRWEKLLDQQGLDWMVTDEHGNVWVLAIDGYPPVSEAFLPTTDLDEHESEHSVARQTVPPRIHDHSSYKAYMNSLEWKRKSQKIMRRDSWTCRYCGSRESLQVHHLTYERLYKEKPCDLITLCEECHLMQHGK